MAAVETKEGVVVRITGPDYVVLHGSQEVRCSLRGRFRLEREGEDVLPVVGDRIAFRTQESPDFRAQTGLIVSILPRRSIFARRDPSGRKGYRVLCANLDFVILVFSVRDPRLNLRLVDRMLVAAEAGRMEPVICINKMDLAGAAEDVIGEVDHYGSMGYKVIFCSALRRSGLEPLRDCMKGKASIMVGPSGSGKSSIISLLSPGLELKIASVSDKTGKGRHTTTHFELHPLPGGGYLGDTPGIREFGIWGVGRDDLDEQFRDFDQYRTSCRFSSCTHSHEPGCAVKEAVEKGLLPRVRYDSYLRILRSLDD